MSKIEIATEEEIKKYANVDITKDTEAAKRLAIWQKLSDPYKVFFLPMEEEDGSLKLYVEPAREHEIWLFGIVIAFSTEAELLIYVQKVANKTYDGDISTFHVWEGTMGNLCGNLANTPKDKGIRVELHSVDGKGIFSYVDTLWDNITT